jgi:hypothetical protein
MDKLSRHSTLTQQEFSMKFKATALILALLLTLLLTSVSWAESEEPYYVELQDGWFRITLTELEFGDYEGGTSTWTFFVEELGSGKGFKDLSHWVVGLPECAEFVSADPEGYEVGTDPRTGVYGVKWEVDDSFTDGYFSVTVVDTCNAELVTVATKAGPKSETGELYLMNNSGGDEPPEPQG